MSAEYPRVTTHDLALDTRSGFGSLAFDTVGATTPATLRSLANASNWAGLGVGEYFVIALVAKGGIGLRGNLYSRNDVGDGNFESNYAHGMFDASDSDAIGFSKQLFFAGDDNIWGLFDRPETGTDADFQLIMLDVNGDSSEVWFDGVKTENIPVVPSETVVQSFDNILVGKFADDTGNPVRKRIIEMLFVSGNVSDYPSIINTMYEGYFIDRYFTMPIVSPEL